MKKYEFKINECNKYIYFKDTRSDHIILYFYMTCLFIGNIDKIIKFAKYMLNSRFIILCEQNSWSTPS